MKKLPEEIVQHILLYLPFWRDRRNFEYAFSKNTETFPTKESNNNLCKKDKRFFGIDTICASPDNDSLSRTVLYDPIRQSHVHPKTLQIVGADESRYAGILCEYENFQIFDGNKSLLFAFDNVIDEKSKRQINAITLCSQETLALKISLGYFKTSSMFRSTANIACPFLAEQLAALKNLKTLRASMNGEMLRIYSNSIEFGEYSNLIHIEGLILESMSKQTRFSCFKQLKSLTIMITKNTSVADLEYLSEFQSVEKLIIKSEQVTNFEPLAKVLVQMPNLVELSDVSGTMFQLMSEYQRYCTKEKPCGISRLALRGKADFEAKWETISCLKRLHTLTVDLKTYSSSLDIVKAFPQLKHVILSVEVKTTEKELLDVVWKIRSDTASLPLNFFSVCVSSSEILQYMTARKIRAIFSRSEFVSQDFKNLKLYLHKKTS